MNRLQENVNRMDPASVRSVFLYRNGAVGDTVLTAPVLRALRLRFSNATLRLVGYLERCRLLVREGLAHEAHSSEAFPLHRLRDTAALPPELTGLFDDVQVVLWYGPDPRGELMANLERLVPLPIVHPPEPVSKTNGHIVEHLLTPARILGCTDCDPRVLLPVTAAEIERGKSILRRHELHDETELVLLTPGASASNKRWPIERFAEAFTRLCERESRPLHAGIVVGPDEERLGVELHRALPDCSTLFEILSLDELAALMTAASLFVGNDSGTTHLAAALGLPSLAVFLVTDPRGWAPVGLRSAYYQCEGDTDPERVADLAHSLLNTQTGKENNGPDSR